MRIIHQTSPGQAPRRSTRDLLTRIFPSRFQRLIQKPFFAPLLLGAIVRFLVAPWTEQRWDSYTDRLMGAYVFGYGINPLFPERSCSGCLPILNYSYPPIWLLIELSLFLLWRAATSFQFPLAPTSLWALGVSSGNIFQAYRSFVPPYLPLLDTLFKTPIILSDIGIGYLIWAMGGKTTKSSRVSLFGWILNPYAIAVSAVWGEFDSVAILFLMLSINSLGKGNAARSGLWLSLGVTTKLFPIAVLPALFLFLVRNRRKQIIRYILGFTLPTAAVFSTLLAFPYPFEFVVRLLTGRASPNINGVNQFSGLSWMVAFNLLPSPPQFPLVLVLLPLTLLAVLFLFRRNIREESLIPLLTASLLSLYLSYPIVNVQYVLWALPLLSLLVLKNGSWKIFLAGFSAIGGVMLLISNSLIYFVSPALIFDETNYPPASDVIEQLWPYFGLLWPILALTFSALVAIAIWKLAGHSIRIRINHYRSQETQSHSTSSL